MDRLFELLRDGYGRNGIAPDSACTEIGFLAIERHSAGSESLKSCKS